MPWLLLAGKARANNDASTEAAAFAQAAKAHKADACNFSLYAFAEPELPSDMTPLERWILGVDVVGIESATGSLQYTSASKHCAADAMRDGETRQQCKALAELLVTAGTTLLDLGMGTHIGERAGWAETRIVGLTDEREALMQAIAQATPSNDGDLWTCDGASRGNAYLSEWARLGEIGAARDSMERSGETVPELAQKQRDFIDKIRRDALAREELSPAGMPQ